MRAEWFAPRLRELREARGWTQQQLAETAGVSLGAVQSFEQGNREPGWSRVIALAVALGVGVEAFTQEPVNQPTPRRGRPRKQAVGQAPAGPDVAVGPAEARERARR